MLFDRESILALHFALHWTLDAPPSAPSDEQVLPTRLLHACVLLPSYYSLSRN
jgi:hypothetical protein